MSVNPKQWHVGLASYKEVGLIPAEDLRAQGVVTCRTKLLLSTER